MGSNELSYLDNMSADFDTGNAIKNCKFSLIPKVSLLIAFSVAEYFVVMQTTCCTFCAHCTVLSCTVYMVGWRLLCVILFLALDGDGEGRSRALYG